MSEVKAPWIKNLGDLPAELEYPEGSMFDMVRDVVKAHPNVTAYEFMGTSTSYAKFYADIHRCAKALRAYGVSEGERVTICMPNAPQAVVMFYAVNLIGAVSNMIHPLSSANEIEFYFRESGSTTCLALDSVYDKVEAARKRYPLKHLILTSVKDALNPVMKAGYQLTEGRKVKRVPASAPVIWWDAFIKTGDDYSGEYIVKKQANDPAVILYSGGTTGKTKGILLSNLNFNALATQVLAVNPMFSVGDRMLAIMPIFHGFGLGISIHTMLANGGCCLLIPRFNAETYAGLLKKHQPNFIAGVPTLFEALLRLSSMNGVELSCLKGVFSGGDTLPPELKKRFDVFLKQHNATVEIREGFGTTECVTASCLTPPHMSREGSIGFPFPDTFYKIVAVGRETELNYGEEGEICISGPTVMLEYINSPEETADTLRKHADGRVWVHTGDLGFMDEDGFVYFRQRIKRMIITSGYNVYPSQVEAILDSHEKVHLSCIIGVPDTYKMHKIKAFIVLKPGVEPSEKVKESILAYCRKNIIRYAVPYDIEFRKELPKTLVGKVNYRLLEEEEAAKRA